MCRGMGRARRETRDRVCVREKREAAGPYVDVDVGVCVCVCRLDLTLMH